MKEQAWVDFNIGRYRDRVLCDILPMDACHLLLGRPWKYDIEAQYDGRKNIYNFKKGEEPYTIQSLLEGEKNSMMELNVLLVAEKEFLNTMKEGEGTGYSIIVKPQNAQNTIRSQLPREEQDLLNQFDDIVSDGNHTFPPKRAISHQIEFIPREALPNKAAY